MKNTKIVLLSLLLILFISCKTKILECEITGYIYNTENKPISNVEIGGLIEIEPMHWLHSDFPDAEIDEKGKFILNLKYKNDKEKTTEQLYFRKEGYEDIYKIVNLKNKKVSLDTIFLKKVVE